MLITARGVALLSEDVARKILKDVGLTEKETDVYIFLAKHGASKGLEITKRIKKHKAQVYNILKNLQTKGLVEPTLEFPTRFTAVPFEKVIDLSAKAKRDEAAFIENAKKEILSYWSNMGQSELEASLEKFVVIEGRNKIYNKISQLITETKSQFSAVSTVPGLLNAQRFGIFDAVLNHPPKSNIQFRFLIELAEKDLDALKAILKAKHQVEFDFRGRTPNLGTKLSPRMVIRDDEELMLFVTPRMDASDKEQNETCFWTNCKTLVLSFLGVFRDMWQSSMGIEDKIVEIEASKVEPRAFDISDAEEAKVAYDRVMESAKDEIMMITSIKGLAALAYNVALLKRWAARGISAKIMAPVTHENFNAAQQLSEFCEVRHVPTDYLETTLVDGQHMFQFKNPLQDQQNKASPHFENMIYAIDYEYLKKTKSVLDELWKNALALSRFTLQSFVNPPAPAVMPPNKTRWNEYAKTMIKSKGKFGGLTEKEVLDKIINAQKSPAKTWKDAIIFYGSHATAVIHPPDHFHLPDMVINIYHNNKQSSFGAEDFLIISLWLETPKNHAYVPVALVTDNPRGEALRKSVWAGTPIEQNFQIVKKDELQVRVQGNTLFAGWTVPIPLLPPKYMLPPSCILFEGYGKLVSGISKTIVPSGRKVTTEYNGLESFVTFFHPSSKYSGPGTDGLLARDAVTTSVALPK
jgi:sugar-specific transcriptional regulator TrmB